MARDFDRRAQRLNVNLRQSVTSARNLSFAAADFSGKFGVAVNASAALAENIAKASRNARIAASATGIGAIVAVIATLGAATLSWREQTKKVALQVRDVRNETAQLNAAAANNKRLERELQIQNAMQGELDAVKGMESILRKFPALQDAIRAKAAAARRAVGADIDRTFKQGRRESFFDEASARAAIEGPQASARQGATEKRLRALDDLEGQGFSPEQMAERRDQIEAAFDAEVDLLEHEVVKPLGDQLGRSFAGAIADGISAAVAQGDIGAGFRALTGGLLIGFGDMMVEIGTQALLAAKLLLKIITALRNFSPAGAIGPALALIAAGSVLKGVGAAMGGRGGGGGGRSSGGAGGGSGFTDTRYIGLVNPLNPAPNTAGLMGAQPVTVNATFIGKDDPRAQRELLEMISRAQRRGSTNG